MRRIIITEEQVKFVVDRMIEEQIGGRAEHFDGRFSLAETGLFLDDGSTGWPGCRGLSAL